ncbi:hypothetical protein JO84_gp072 [Aureococcus anophagefferens virus]|uniref:BspA family leucine-rich repeat surface protein n=1 Tax=Aureococcus anophagefferens virus TaxID=1474867 RepID=A0A076FHP7_9VIRU|nr:hypothetical protein JO84_gp072 [Aureococcus anophagefferens virus]AII16941.1 hypothetical protein AaV_072 [Aureococcus anophagefferens virus]UOG94372.1 hypothetical protein MKD35_337 [Aureococcus anophagefferens virus]
MSKTYTQEEQIDIVKKITCRLPFDVEKYIAEFRKKPLDNHSIKWAVENYKKGGDDKIAIEKIYGKIQYWDTSEVTRMTFLFLDAYYFNEDISEWDVSKVTDMCGMFYHASCFNQDISGWDVSNVTNMKSMFEGDISFNQPIGKWGKKTGKVTTMESMFEDTNNFNQDISEWDVSEVTTMESMFNNAEKFDQDISEWDVSKVTNMNCMFCLSYSFNQPIGNWNIESLQIMNCMFMNSSMERCNYFALIQKYSAKDFVIEANSITSGDFTELHSLVRSEIIYNEYERIVNQESILMNNQNNLSNALEARDAAKAVLNTYCFYANCNYCVEHAHRTFYDDAITAWNTAANAYILIHINTIWEEVVSNFAI